VTAAASRPTADHGVVIVGGRPAGCSPGVVLDRAALDTVIDDRSRASPPRCAHHETCLGTPEGIDIETGSDRMHLHAETAGCTGRDDLVESVARADDAPGSVVTPPDGDPVTARRVVAATRSGGEYLRGLADDANAAYPSDARGVREVSD